MLLILHRGAQNVPEEALQTVPLPESTKSYRPIPHAVLALFIKEQRITMLSGFTHSGLSYGLKRNGQQFFGIHTYWSDQNEARTFHRFSQLL